MRLPMMRAVSVSMLALIIALITSIQNNANRPVSSLEIGGTASSATVLQAEPNTASTYPEPIAGAIGPVEFASDINPLTGLRVDDIHTLERRPMVVKISNAPPLVRPQAGIGQADLVFEHYAEGGLTRFSAVFYGEMPTRVGSIRSARLIDHEIVPMVDGLLVFSGASLGVETYIYGSDVIDPEFRHAPHREIPPSEYAQRAYKGIFYGPPYFWRDESIPIPHNMFANPEAIWEMAESEGFAQRPHLRGFAFHPDLPAGDTGSVNEIDLRYRATRVRWVYDADQQKYLRYADGLPHFDANTQQQVTADNVVIMYSEHVETEIIESQWQGNISWSLQIQMWDQQPVILFRNGKRYDGYWTRTVREDLISLRTMDGELLYLKPGQTWFQVVRLQEQQEPKEEWLSVQ
jgi:hypothetical protein